MFLFPDFMAAQPKNDACRATSVSSHVNLRVAMHNKDRVSLLLSLLLPTFLPARARRWTGWAGLPTVSRQTYLTLCSVTPCGWRARSTTALLAGHKARRYSGLRRLDMRSEKCG